MLSTTVRLQQWSRRRELGRFVLVTVLQGRREMYAIWVDTVELNHLRVGPLERARSVPNMDNGALNGSVAGVACRVKIRQQVDHLDALLNHSNAAQLFLCLHLG